MTAAERCCRECRGVPGVCRDRRNCWCHLEQAAIAREQDNSPESRPPHRDPVGERVANRNSKRRRKRKGG